MSDDSKRAERPRTFAQRHLGAPLPTQLNREDMPERLRFKLWAVVDASIQKNTRPDNYVISTRVPGQLYSNWLLIMAAFHMDYMVRPHDHFNPAGEIHRGLLRQIITERSYDEVYGALDFILQHPACPADLPGSINRALESCMAAWRVYDGNLLGPLASQEEANTIAQAFNALAKQDYEGARAHLRAAVKALANGGFAESIRESISAVEGAARAIEPSKHTLNEVMKKLVATGKVSRALSQGLEKLYAWTSDEKGIRHALVFEDKANVDEADALFMVGACAAFVTYLTARARESPEAK